LIDGFGTQAHTFNVDPMANQPSVLADRISLMASGGVPVFVTELDLAGQQNTEASQLRSYQELFPVYWEHPDVAGITLWGYVEGSTWKEGTGLLNADGTKKDAMLWLEDYMVAQDDVGYPHAEEVDDSTPIFGPSQDTSRFFNAWPNPVEGELKISEIAEFGGSETTYKVFDTNGNIVAGGSFRDHTEVSFEALPSGIYFIQLINGAKVDQIKVLNQ
jgi:hypothetical protein